MAAPDGEPGPKRTSPAQSRSVARSRESFRTHFCTGLLVLIAIEFFIAPLFFLLVPSAKEDENFLTIFPMELSGFMHGFALSNSVDYTFVDVDDFTFSKWRTNGHTDRRKIKELISRIASDKYNNPKAIIVDIDLSASLAEKSGTDRKLTPYVERCPEDGVHYPTGDETSNLTPEQALTFYVCEYAGNRDNPPLIFVQSLRRRPSPFEDGLFELVPLIFEKPKPKYDSPSLIYFATSGFLRSADSTVRSWLLAEPACDEGDQVKTISSVELLLLPMRLENDPGEGRFHPDVVNDKVQNFYRGNCRSVETPMPPEIQLGNQKIRLSSMHLRDRIVYTIKWNPEKKNRLTGRAHYIIEEKIFELRRADLNDLFSGRVVIIGGSNDESRDIYNTPYGPMPGAVILINAIDSLRVDYQIRELSYWAEKIVSFAIGLIVMVMLEFFLRIEMGPIVYLLGYVLGVGISIVFLYFGVWFGVSGVIFGGVAHLIAKGALDIWEDMKEDPQHKLRVLLIRQLRHQRDGKSSG